MPALRRCRNQRSKQGVSRMNRPFPLRRFFLTAALFIFSLSFSAAAQAGGGETDAGRPFYDFAVFAYEDGKYADALAKLRTALRHGPENPWYHHYMGKTLMKLDRMKKARYHLDKALALRPDITGLAHDRAYLDFTEKHYDEAADRFVRIADADDRNVTAHYYAGLSLYRIKSYAKAPPYFRHAAKSSPTLQANGYYYAGICHEKAGEHAEALEMFSLVAEDETADQALRDNAERWIAALEQRHGKDRDFHLFLKLGRRYDDNALLEPADDDTIFEDERDWASLVCFSARYDVPQQSSWSAGAGFTHYQILYDDLEEYDFTGDMLQVYAGYSLGNMILRLHYMPAYYRAGTDGYLRRHRIEPEFRWRPAPQILTRLIYRYSDNDYLDNPEKSGYDHAVYGDAAINLFNGNGRVFGGLGYASRAADQADEEFDRYKLRCGLSLDLPWRMELLMTGQYEAREYRSEDRIYGVKRDDDKLTASLTLSRPLFYDWLGVMAEYRLVDNTSNINDYEYTRNIWTLSMTALY